jgi:hypothetical protein
LVAGFFAMLGTAALAARLIWEQTIMSWEQGPQMIGFSLAHGTGFFLFFFPVLLCVWLVVAGAILGWRFWKIRKAATFSLQAVLSAISLLVLLNLGQQFWMRLFFERFVTSPHATKFFIGAACRGDLSMVKAFLAHGIPTDARDREEKTALLCASQGGSTDVVAYLISKGADVNAVSLWGDSPLEVANAGDHANTVKILTANGAVRLRGTEAQRNEASRIIVRRDIEAENLRKR